MVRAGGSIRRFLSVVLLGMPLAACDDNKTADYQPEYVIKAAVADKSYRVSCPFSTPEMLFSVYQPLVDYINKRLIGSRLKLEASRDYESFEQKLYYRNLDFALANPYQTVMAVPNGYRIFAKMSDDTQFRGVVLVRRDGGVEEVGDLIGKAVSYPAASALASTLLPQAFFHQHGVNVKTDLDNRYVGSEESAILNVYLGNAAAGTTWPLAWRRFQRDEPAKAAQLMVKWETETLPNNGWVARDDVPPELVDRVRTILTAMRDDPEGRQVLEHVMIAGFEAADDKTFEPVQAFLRHFNATVREVALP